MDAIGRLAGGVAHDFNNVLTIIKGYADLLLLRLGKRNSLRPYAEEIKKATNQAALVTRQLLIFSRQEMAQPAVIDLNAVVVDIEKMLNRLIGEDIDLVTVLDPDLGLIKANPGHIEQVIMNLVINARDAMPQGGGITIETANITLDEIVPYQSMPIQPGQYVQLTVSDTGMGMDEKTLSHIFEPFYTTKEPDKGTGLGLSTVYAIVTQSKGGLQVFSQPGHGTTFSVYLPCLTDPMDTTSKKQKSEGLSVIAGKKIETILLVEDQAELRELAKLVLQEQGYRVLEARHGDEALQICLQNQEPIHLILTDVVMPGGISGRELVERVKPLLPETKVIYMSGYTDDVIVRHGVLNASINFLQKPFAPNILLTKVREVLDTPE
jgi:CheY-like chemotaxis protein